MNKSVETLEKAEGEMDRRYLIKNLLDLVDELLEHQRRAIEDKSDSKKMEENTIYEVDKFVHSSLGGRGFLDKYVPADEKGRKYSEVLWQEAEENAARLASEEEARAAIKREKEGRKTEEPSRKSTGNKW